MFCRKRYQAALSERESSFHRIQSSSSNSCRGEPELIEALEIFTKIKFSVFKAKAKSLNNVLYKCHIWNLCQAQSLNGDDYDRVTP